MSLLSNLRYAVASLRSSPGITLTLVLTIAIGVGSNAAVFGFVRGLLFAVPPISDPSSLVGFYHRATGGEYEPWSIAEYERLQSTTAATTRAIAAERETRAFVAADAGGGSAPVAEVTTSFFPVIGVAPAAGAMPTGDSDSSGVVISAAEWRRDFKARTDIAGAEMQVDRRPYRVAAVAPEGFDGLALGRPVDVWIVLGDNAFAAGDRDAHVLSVIGRLPGHSIDDLARAVSTAEVVRYSPIEPAMRDRVRGIGTLLLMAVGMVFVVACANLIALLLSLAAARSAPLSIRVALGASRAALAQQLVADTTVLAVVGAAAGWLLALWTSHLIPVLLFAEDAERLRFDPSPAALVVASLLTLVFMLACSLTPMVRVPHRQPMAILRRTADRLAGTGGPFRAGVVVVQMAMSSILLISSVRLVQDVHRSLHTDLGDRVAGLAIASVSASTRFESPSSGRRFFEHAQETVDHLAGVSASAWVQTLPGGRALSSRYRIAAAGGGRMTEIDVQTFDSDVFSKGRLHAIAGRLFGGGDAPHGCQVAIVNEEGEHAWFDGDAVGRSLTDAEGHRIDVVGVVPAPTEAAAIHARPMVFFYAPQSPDPPGIVRRVAVHVSVPLSVASDAVLEDNIAGQRYFELFGLTPVSGWIPRDDDAAMMCPVGVVNAEAADRYFGGAAVGGAIVDASGRRIEIVAVTPSGVFRALQPPVQPMLYRPPTQTYAPIMTLVARTDATDGRLFDEIRKRVNGVQGAGGVSRPERLDGFFGRTSMASERITSALVGVCAVLALVLALTGVSGVIADSVSRRTREFGLKAALGARGWHILGPLALEGMKLASAGAVAGAVIALFAAHALDRIAQAPSMSARGLLAWLAVPVALVAVSAIATLLPARRAVRADPLVVMKAVDS